MSRNNGHNGNGDFSFFDSTKSYNDEVKEFIDTWNKHIWLPKIKGSDRQAKLIKEALKRVFFKNNWRESFAILAKSSCLFRKYRFQLEWFLIPDNFDKVVDEKYVDDMYRERLPLPKAESGGNFGVERIEINGVIEERFVQLPVIQSSSDDETL